jgi:hypothetical protein
MRKGKKLLQRKSQFPCDVISFWICMHALDNQLACQSGNPP